MMKTFFTAILLLFATFAFAQYEYAPSPEHPFGQPHPDAPEQLKDYELLIGICDCRSSSRIDATTWADTVDMIWTYRYIMNGKGVQDETLKSDGTHSGSIRQYNVDSTRWYVHYYTSRGATPTLRSWEGNTEESGNIILYNEQKAPNGTDGFFRITFSEITEDGFNWLGEWVNTAETFSYPTWRISCKKRR